MKDESTEFILFNLKNQFSQITKHYVMENMYWIDIDDHARAVAQMSSTDPNNSLNNLILLFPPYYPSK